MPLPAPTGSYGTLAPAIREDRSTRGLSQEGRGVSVLADGAGRAARGARGLRTVRCRPPALGLGLAAAVSRSHAGSRPDAGRRRRTPSGAPQRPGRAAAAAGWSVSAAPAPPPGYLLPTASPALPISLPLRVARPVRRRARLHVRGGVEISLRSSLWPPAPHPLCSGLPLQLSRCSANWGLDSGNLPCNHAAHRSGPRIVSGQRSTKP